MGQESSPSQDDIERNIFWCKGRQVLRCFVENNRQNHFTSSPDERDERNKVLLARGSSAVSSDYKEPNFIKKLREMKSLIEEWGPMSMNSDEGLRVILDFNPSAASISLSTFRRTDYGFQALTRTFKKDNYSQKHGNCRMTRSYSYRNVQPIVAKLSNIQYKCVAALAATAITAKLTSQPKLRQILMVGAMADASYFEYKCVSAIMAIMTAIAANLISQPNLNVIIMMAGMAMLLNFVEGLRAGCTPNFSPPWYTGVSETIQYIPVLSNLFVMPEITIAYTLGASILGQALGSMTRHLDSLNTSDTKASVGGSDST